MEEAVVKIGLRADCASLIWNIYLDFEKMILNSMSGEKNEKQRKHVESLYGRLLSVPHLGLQESWNEYKEFAGNFYCFSFTSPACFSKLIFAVVYFLNIICA